MRYFIITLLAFFLTACTVNFETTKPAPIINLISMGAEQKVETQKGGLGDMELADLVYQSQFCEMPTLKHLLNIPVPDKEAFKANNDTSGYVNALKAFVAEYERLSIIVEQEYQECL